MSLKETSCPDCWQEMVDYTCDSCKSHNRGHGSMVNMSEWLRAKGWTTAPGTKVTDPLLWRCPDCSKKT